MEMPGAWPKVGSSPGPPGRDPDTWHGAASWHSPVSCSVPVGTQGLGPFCSGWLQPQLVPFKSATRGGEVWLGLFFFPSLCFMQREEGGRGERRFFKPRLPSSLPSCLEGSQEQLAPPCVRLEGSGPLPRAHRAPRPPKTGTAPPALTLLCLEWPCPALGPSTACL